MLFDIVPTGNLQTRRQKLFEEMETNSVFILFSAEIVPRNTDVEYPFRQDSSFFYLTGLNEEKSLYLLKKDSNGGKIETLLVTQKNHTEEIWTGKVNGIDKSRKLSGIEHIENFSLAQKIVEELISNSGQVYFDPIGSYQSLRNSLAEIVFSKARRSDLENLTKVIQTNFLIKNLRIYKDDWEIEQMKKSCQIASTAQILSVQKMHQNLELNKQVFEYQVEADIYHYFNQNGTNWSYPAIVAGGFNACILHYTANNQELQKGELLLIDSGCEYNYYASDITRCFPIGGKFSTAQKAIYELVLKANTECIEHLATNQATYRSYHELSIQILTQGLIDLKILTGSLEQNLTQKTYLKYYMHSIGHWLGLDVHDLGEYRDQNGKRPDIAFAPGMSVTVEPGLYFDALDETIASEFRGIGVRIEDDIIRTKDGILNLTRQMPKTVSEIESLF